MGYLEDRTTVPSAPVLNNPLPPGSSGANEIIVPIVSVMDNDAQTSNYPLNNPLVALLPAPTLPILTIPLSQSDVSSSSVKPEVNALVAD